MPSAPRSSVLQVNRLGDLMRDLEEEREAEDIVAARRRERHAQTDAEREELAAGPGVVVGDEREVVGTFERILLELFLDGKDVRPFFVPIKTTSLTPPRRCFHTISLISQIRKAGIRCWSRIKRMRTLMMRMKLIFRRAKGTRRKRSKRGSTIIRVINVVMIE
jgi:hypothetical protein